jgi:hypothetical protein
MCPFARVCVVTAGLTPRGAGEQTERRGSTATASVFVGRGRRSEVPNLAGGIVCCYGGWLQQAQAGGQRVMVYDVGSGMFDSRSLTRCGGRRSMRLVDRVARCDRAAGCFGGARVGGGAGEGRRSINEVRTTRGMVEWSDGGGEQFR